MTAEIPQQTGGRCTDCGQQIGLDRTDMNTLQAQCGCESRSVRVKDLLPDGWDV